MKCYDCGHRAHGGEDCAECGCPTWRDPVDETLRERPSEDLQPDPWEVQP